MPFTGSSDAPNTVVPSPASMLYVMASALPLVSRYCMLGDDWNSCLTALESLPMVTVMGCCVVNHSLAFCHVDRLPRKVNAL